MIYKRKTHKVLIFHGQSTRKVRLVLHNVVWLKSIWIHHNCDQFQVEQFPLMKGCEQPKLARLVTNRTWTWALPVLVVWSTEQVHPFSRAPSERCACRVGAGIYLYIVFTLLFVVKSRVLKGQFFICDLIWHPSIVIVSNREISNSDCWLCIVIWIWITCSWWNFQYFFHIAKKKSQYPFFSNIVQP